MTKNEAVGVILAIQGTYPMFHRDSDKQMLSAAVTAWQGTFAAVPLHVVSAALAEYIANDDKGRAPWPGAINAIVRAKAVKKFVQTGTDDAGYPTGYWEDGYADC